MPGAQEYVHRSMPNLMVHPFPHPPWPKLVSLGPVESELASVLLTLHALVGVYDFACDDGVGVGGGEGTRVVLDALWMLGRDAGILKWYYTGGR